MERMKGCISISLYGQAAKYSFGAIENAKLAPKLYPGWTLVIHAERGHYAIPKLKALGAEVVEMDPLPGSGGMFWRFLPVDWSDRFTHVIIRDADSRLNVRDRACTDAWIESGKDLHVIRDHPAHERIAILGGAWGLKTETLPMKELISNWSHNYRYGDDESFLEKIVWPIFYPNSFIRHSYLVKSDEDTEIPEHAPYEGFVCEQIKPEFNEPFDAFVLSPEKYSNRRKRFFDSLNENGGFLNGKVDWWKGTTMLDRVVPNHVDHSQEFPHYYLASRDHIDIIEQGILKDTKLLFVFEDDAVFEPDFVEYFLRMWVALPDNWRASMLGGQPWTDRARSIVTPESSLALASVHGCLGMHGVLWNQQGMRRAFDHFTFWNRMTIDQAFKGLQKSEHGFYAPAKWIVGIDNRAIQHGLDN
jgi:hypothetical protein